MDKNTTISSYSKKNYCVYDDPMNLNFVYGEITTNFVGSVQFSDSDNVIADIGCGTGFAFDILRDMLEKREGRFIGVEPAEGMLEAARKKYEFNPKFEFYQGTFDEIPLEDNSVDKIISTLAMHWVPDMESSIKELYRVLKPTGSIDILMIAKDDGEGFKRPIVKAMQKQLTFTQIMKAASLAQRLSAGQLKKQFAQYFTSASINVDNLKKVICGSFEEHLKWWKARSRQIIHEIGDKDMFFDDMKKELNKLDKGHGIPFDISVLQLHLKGK